VPLCVPFKSEGSIMCQEI